ncbi:MAG: hypothetical protein SGJ09_12570 [Phycisphaerae bacterium]|nr:hypothetical protein [Phycisphaerae bacterium]
MPQNSPPLWLRTSLTLAALHAPLSWLMSWLIWFDDDLGYQRSLLALWLASAMEALVAAGTVVGVVALMRSS